MITQEQKERFKDHIYISAGLVGPLPNDPKLRGYIEIGGNPYHPEGEWLASFKVESSSRPIRRYSVCEDLHYPSSFDEWGRTAFVDSANGMLVKRMADLVMQINEELGLPVFNEKDARYFRFMTMRQAEELQEKFGDDEYTKKRDAYIATHMEARK